MCFFKYREKRYGKTMFVLFGLLMVAAAVASVWGGIYGFTHLTNYWKYISLVAGIIGGLGFGGFGLFLLMLSTSLINSWKSVRDGNKSKGTANVRLCDKCGKVITKKAEFCEHCGAKQETGLGLKKCPECKTSNSGNAKFCEKCGYEF